MVFFFLNFSLQHIQIFLFPNYTKYLHCFSEAIPANTGFFLVFGSETLAIAMLPYTAQEKYLIWKLPHAHAEQ